MTALYIEMRNALDLRIISTKIVILSGAPLTVIDGPVVFPLKSRSFATLRMTIPQYVQA
jgi:hypothetical protein